MVDKRFTRVTAPTVSLQMHVTGDSRYVLLPRVRSASPIEGWVIYDAVNGELMTPNNDYPSAPAGGFFGTLHEARDWLNLYREGA